MAIRSFLILMAAIALVTINAAGAEIITDISLGGGHQGNLFNDSLSAGDSYTTFGATVRIYPSSSTEISVHGLYNAYSSTKDLSNRLSGASITMIPTGEQSSLTLMLSGEISQKRFGDLFSLYDKKNLITTALISYRLASALLFKSRASYSTNVYDNSEYNSNHSVELAGGINFTLFGANSLDAEATVSKRKFDKMPVDAVDSPNGNFRGMDESEEFSIIDYSFRYSRPMGKRTGVNIVLARRLLRYSSYRPIAGYSIDYLSPWSELWHGAGISAGLKHHFAGQVTLTIQGELVNKSYVDAIEYDIDGSEEYQLTSREDTNLNIQASLSKSISAGKGTRFIPVAKIVYAHNNSSHGFFSYDALSMSIILNLHL